MADDFDYDIDGFDDDAWLYVDDEFDLADELAEGQVPEPGYAGNNAEIDSETYDYEFYHYWDDLEYGDDAYWDSGLPGADDNKAGVKRKRSAAKKAESLVDKRRRLDLQAYEVYTREQDPLIFCSRAERIRPRKADVLRKDATKFALLPDWRKRFTNDDGLLESGEMPLDMKRAAETEISDMPMEASEDDGEGEDGWEDDEGDDDEGETPSLDLDMLKQVLKQRLGEAGLDGMDEDAFMQTIAKMLSSGDDADDAAGELANSLLGKLISESGAGEGEALSGWLSQQGVSMTNENDDDDASSVATVELPADRRPSATRSQWPTSKDTTATQHDAETSAQFTSAAQKRTAESMATDGKSVKRQKKVTFDVPPSATSSDPAETTTSAAEPLLTSEDPLMSAPTVNAQVKPQVKTSAPPSARTSNIASGESSMDAPSQEKPMSTSRKRKANTTSEDAGVGKENLEAKPPPEKKTRTSSRGTANRTEKTKAGAVDDTTASTTVARSTRSRAAKKNG